MRTNIVRLKGADKPQLVDIDDVPGLAEAGLIEAYYDEDWKEIDNGDDAKKVDESPTEATQADDQAQQAGGFHQEG
jgi:hypothetical protein